MRTQAIVCQEFLHLKLAALQLDVLVCQLRDETGVVIPLLLPRAQLRNLRVLLHQQIALLGHLALQGIEALHHRGQQIPIPDLAAPGRLRGGWLAASSRERSSCANRCCVRCRLRRDADIIQHPAMREGRS